ncbi:MAG: clan AA aspartic protease [Capsulimonadaceae bacterium]
MILGHVRDNFPRVSLLLPFGTSTSHVEFIIDTGSDGELALPAELAHRLVSTYAGSRPILLADGTTRLLPVYRVDMEWIDEVRPTDIYILDGNPLLGVELLNGNTIQIDMTDGGEVTIGPI